MFPWANGLRGLTFCLAQWLLYRERGSFITGSGTRSSAHGQLRVTGAYTSYPSTMSTKSNVDVLIIGAGPAGLMCANGLARAGMNVRIVDQR